MASDHLFTIPGWVGSPRLVSGFTGREFGTLSARCDSPEAVDRRFQSLADQLAISSDRMVTVPQTHSNNVVILRDLDLLERRTKVRSFRFAENELFKGDVLIDSGDFDPAWQKGIDGMIVATEEIFPVILTADCAPVFFHDPQTRVCGIAHVGLVGAFNQLAARMVTLMNQQFGVDPTDLEIAILPSIRGCHYNLAKSGVWQRMRETITRVYGEENQHYRTGYFDLPGFIRWQIEATGVLHSSIRDLGICTVCQAERFFSHVYAGINGDQAKEGRFGSVIGRRRGNT